MIRFDSAHQTPHHAGEHTVVVPPRLESRTALFAFLHDALHLPAYFGHNWDALEECLNDVELLGGQRVVLVHHDLPLENDPEQERLYLLIVGAAARDSARLDAVFPETYRAQVMKSLAST